MSMIKTAAARAVLSHVLDGLGDRVLASSRRPNRSFDPQEDTQLLDENDAKTWQDIVVGKSPRI